MRVIFNQLSGRGLRTGVGHYTHHLESALQQRAEVEVHSFPSDQALRFGVECQHLLAYLKQLQSRWGGMRKSMSVTLLGGASRWLAARASALARAAARNYRDRLFFGDGYDLYHEPNFVPLPSSLPTVTTLHDLSILLYPQWHPAKRVRWFEDHLGRTLGQSQHFVTDSETVRQELIQILGVEPESVNAVSFGIRPGLRPLPEDQIVQGLRRLGLPPSYLLYVGTIEPRKNLLRLMQVYCSLSASLRERYPFVLAGSWGWNVEPEWEFYHYEARHRGVIHLGYVADADLPVIYNGARALVYPSFYEGFGLPPVEMLACGGAVLASTAAALVETVGPQAHLVPAADADGWRWAVSRVLTDDDWWAARRAGAVEFASQYTWQRCARATVEVYRSTVGHPGAHLALADVPHEEFAHAA